MDTLTDEALREAAVSYAKDFKTSWIELGRILYAINKNNDYKFWGYTTFEGYAQKELGIRQKTAQKLLKSYSFLENHEPQYLKKDYTEEVEATQIPNYQAIDKLRLAKANKNLTENDYENIKKDVFEKGQDERDVARTLTALVKERKQLDPEEVKMQSRMSVIKRFLTTLKSTKSEIETMNLLPKQVILHADEVIKEIETYM